MAVPVRRVILVSCVLLAFVWGAASEELVILHVNDTHGHLFSTEGTLETGEVGGMARLATLVGRIRADHPGRVLLLHGGDILSRGDPVTVHTSGAANIAVMNSLGYDAMTAGNGDFYWGAKVLSARAREARFPILHANTRPKDETLPWPKPYVVKRIGQVRVGILGVGFIRTGHFSAKKIWFRDPVATAVRLIPELRKKADFIIALSHMGTEADQRLAREVPGISLIVSAHNHEPLIEPLVEEGPDGPVRIVRAGDYGRSFGRVDLELERKGDRWVIAGFKGRHIPVDANTPEDPEMVSLLRGYLRPLEKVVGTIPADLENPSRGTSPLGRLTVEAIRQATGADLALLDRGALVDGLKAGDVTVGDVLRVHPYRNQILLFEMTAAEVKSIAEAEDLLLAGCAFEETGDTRRFVVSEPHADPNHKYAVAAGEFVYATVEAIRRFSYESTELRVDTILEAHFRKKN